MRRPLFTSLLFVFTSTIFAQPPGYPGFEVVESIPIETTLDNPDIPNTLEVWLEMINSARTSLDIEQFYISNKDGEPLEEVIAAIEHAAARGVKVRVIADARMYKTYPETVDRLSRQIGISTRIIDFGKLAGGVQHAKYFIMDGEDVFLGSQNFDWRALKHIHELGLRIRHKDAAAVFVDIFNLDWKLAATNDPALVGVELIPKKYLAPFSFVGVAGDTVIFTPTCSPRSLIPDTTLWDEPHIRTLIDEAKQEVVLQFLSYSPVGRDRSRYDALDGALRRAASRGVNVKMIVSDWQKGTAAEEHLKDLTRVPNIEVKFSVIPEWSGGYISYGRVEHCKFIVADGNRFWLGTSNAEKSYFYTSRNLGVVVKNARIAGIIKRVFMKSWDGPYTELIKRDVKYEPRQHGGE